MGLWSLADFQTSLRRGAYWSCGRQSLLMLPEMRRESLLLRSALDCSFPPIYLFTSYLSLAYRLQQSSAPETTNDVWRRTHYRARLGTIKVVIVMRVIALVRSVIFNDVLTRQGVHIYAAFTTAFSWRDQRNPGVFLLVKQQMNVRLSTPFY